MATGPLSIKLRCASWQQLATIYKRDLSRGTMFLKASVPPAIGTPVKIELTLPSASVIVLTGVVHLHVEHPQSGPGVELKLAPIATGSIWLIESALASEHKRLMTPTSGVPVVGASSMQSGPVATIGEHEEVASAERELVTALMSEAESLKKLNPFLVLGVGYEATDADVRAAFGELTKRYHPDRFARYESTELRQVAAEIFILIRDAYRKLGDEAGRTQALASIGRPAAPRPLPLRPGTPPPVPPPPARPGTQKLPVTRPAETRPPTGVMPRISVDRPRTPAGGIPRVDVGPPPGLPPVAPLPRTDARTPGQMPRISAEPARTPTSGIPRIPADPARPQPARTPAGGIPRISGEPVRPATGPIPRISVDDAPAPSIDARPAPVGNPSTDATVTLPAPPNERRATTAPPIAATSIAEITDSSPLELMLDQGKFDEALAAYKAMGKKHPQDRSIRAGIELCEGLRALANRDRLEAAQRFEAALEIDPSNERAARELADMRRHATNERKGLLSRLMGKKET